MSDFGLKTHLKSNSLLLLLIILLMVGLLMLQTNPLTTLPGRDSGFFMYAGSQILKGKLPYIDFWDSKGPGIFYLNALGLFLGNGYRWGVWLLEYFLLIISSYFFYRSVAKKWGGGAALLSNAAWLYGLSRVWEGGNLTEEYSLFFSFILLSYFLKVIGPPTNPRTLDQRRTPPVSPKDNEEMLSLGEGTSHLQRQISVFRRAKDLSRAFFQRSRCSTPDFSDRYLEPILKLLSPPSSAAGTPPEAGFQDRYLGHNLPQLSSLLGVTFVLSFLFRANNIGIQISLLAALVFSALSQRQYKQIIKVLGWTIISGGVILGLVSIYFLYMGIFSEMFEAAILYNFFYAGAKDHFQLNLWQGIQKIGLPAYLALSGYFAIIHPIVRKKLNFSAPLTLFLLISFPMEVFLSSLSGKNYFHYFISWMPAVAILIAIAYAAFSKAIFSAKFIELFNQQRKSHLLALVILFFVYIATGASREYQGIAKRIFFERAQGIEKADPVASFVREKTTQDDLVLVWGAYPVLNFLAKRDAPTPYLFYPAYETSPFSEKMGATYFQDISTNPPPLIVDASSASPDYILPLDAFARSSRLGYNADRIYNPPYQNEVFSFIEAHYKRIRTVKGFVIYRLIDGD